jgi:hypothetical protein
MALNIVKALVALIFPAVVFLAFGARQSAHSGRDVALKNINPTDAKPLNLRLHYDVNRVDYFWGALGKSGQLAEQRFLEEDLTFPLIYGGALMLSLGWMLWKSELSWSPWLVMLPVVLGMIGDWIENVIQLDQLQRYINAGKNGLDAGAIFRSSLATDIKLAGIASADVLLIVLAIAFVLRTTPR